MTIRAATFVGALFRVIVQSTALFAARPFDRTALPLPTKGA